MDNTDNLLVILLPVAASYFAIVVFSNCALLSLVKYGLFDIRTIGFVLGGCISVVAARRSVEKAKDQLGVDPWKDESRRG